MRFYQLRYRLKPKPIHFQNEIAVYPEGSEHGTQHTEWFGTEREAVVQRNEMFKAGRLVGLKREQMIDPVDIPVDKAGLLRFLKANVPVEVII